MSDLSMLQLKYKDYKEIIMQDLICAKTSLPKKPTPKPRKRKKHDLDQSALLTKDPPAVPSCILCWKRISLSKLFSIQLGPFFPAYSFESISNY